MSPTDPPLPPSPDEPSEEPQWAGGQANRPPGPEGSGDVDEPLPEVDGGLEPDPSAAGDEPTEVLPAVGDEPTDVVPPTGDEPTDVVPPTGDEPTEVLAGAAAVTDGTGELTREHRRRVSHRRYVMRRIGVSVAALALVAGAVVLLLALLGDDDEGASGSATTTPATSEAVIAAVTTQASTTTAAPETTAAEASATTAAVDTSDVDPETTPAPAETDPSEQTDPASVGSDSTAATESSPPGTLVFDLDSEASCEIGQTLRRGDTGPQVECLQERLNEITVSGPQFAVDGAFGEQTETAVRAFQDANELAVDGIVGPATGELLGIWPG